MRRGNASWINETGKKAKCKRQVSVLDCIGVYSEFKDMLRSMFIYNYSLFDFGLDPELDLYGFETNLRDVFQVFAY